jgi:hypothetical protein
MSLATPRARSAAAYERACRVIPGGVNSPARAMGGLEARCCSRLPYQSTPTLSLLLAVTAPQYVAEAM